MLDLILKWAVPFVCGGILTGAITYVKSFKAKTTALENGVQCLLRAEIICAHEKYTRADFCPIYAKETLTRSYKAYHELGGNDVATELYNTVMELPTEAKV